jgi:hypothetical protein
VLDGDAVEKTAAPLAFFAASAIVMLTNLIY